MAQRRMFSKSITNSSQFLMMPQSSQNLYFHLGMNADDDGFCEHFTVMRMTESKPDDLKVLQAKGFVEVFDDKVLVIIDWKENNYLRSDRYTPSKYLAIYRDEIEKLSFGTPKVDQVVTQDRSGKGRKEDKADRLSAPAVFSMKEELQKLEGSPRKDLNTIGFYFEERGTVFENNEQFQVALKRHLRPAKMLIPFTIDQIVDATDKAKREYPEWTLETLVKLLTK